MDIQTSAFKSDFEEPADKVFYLAWDMEDCSFGMAISWNLTYMFVQLFDEKANFPMFSQVLPDFPRWSQIGLGRTPPVVKNLLWWVSPGGHKFLLLGFPRWSQILRAYLWGTPLFKNICLVRIPP
jgi:hypothetical protein